MVNPRDIAGECRRRTAPNYPFTVCLYMYIFLCTQTSLLYHLQFTYVLCHCVLTSRIADGVVGRRASTDGACGTTVDQPVKVVCSALHPAAGVTVLKVTVCQAHAAG